MGAETWWNSSKETGVELFGAKSKYNFLRAECSMSSDMEMSNTGLSKKMEGIWNRYNLKSTGRIYTFGILKCSEKFKVLDLP